MLCMVFGFHFSFDILYYFCYVNGDLRLLWTFAYQKGGSFFCEFNSIYVETKKQIYTNDIKCQSFMLWRHTISQASSNNQLTLNTLDDIQKEQHTFTFVSMMIEFVECIWLWIHEIISWIKSCILSSIDCWIMLSYNDMIMIHI